MSGVAPCLLYDSTIRYGVMQAFGIRHTAYIISYAYNVFSLHPYTPSPGSVTNGMVIKVS